MERKETSTPPNAVTSAKNTFQKLDYTVPGQMPSVSEVGKAFVTLVRDENEKNLELPLWQKYQKIAAYIPAHVKKGFYPQVINELANPTKSKDALSALLAVTVRSIFNSDLLRAYLQSHPDDADDFMQSATELMMTTVQKNGVLDQHWSSYMLTKLKKKVLVAKQNENRTLEGHPNLDQVDSFEEIESRETLEQVVNNAYRYSSEMKQLTKRLLGQRFGIVAWGGINGMTTRRKIGESHEPKITSGGVWNKEEKMLRVLHNKYRASLGLSPLGKSPKGEQSEESVTHEQAKQVQPKKTEQTNTPTHEEQSYIDELHHVVTGLLPGKTWYAFSSAEQEQLTTLAKQAKVDVSIHGNNEEGYQLYFHFGYGVDKRLSLKLRPDRSIAFSRIETLTSRTRHEMIERHYHLDDENKRVSQIAQKVIRLDGEERAEQHKQITYEYLPDGDYQLVEHFK